MQYNTNNTKQNKTKQNNTIQYNTKQCSTSACIVTIRSSTQFVRTYVQYFLYGWGHCTGGNLFIYFLSSIFFLDSLSIVFLDTYIYRCYTITAIIFSSVLFNWKFWSIRFLSHIFAFSTTIFLCSFFWSFFFPYFLLLNLSDQFPLK